MRNIRIHLTQELLCTTGYEKWKNRDLDRRFISEMIKTHFLARILTFTDIYVTFALHQWPLHVIGAL